MYKNREAAWIGFEEAQRTIDALKAEVQIAEEKLSHVKRSLPFEKNKPFLREPLKISSSEVVSDTSNKKSLFIKENAPKKLFYHEKHIRKRRKYTVPKHTDTAKDAEDVFHSASPKPVSIQPLDVDQTVVKTVFNSAFSSVSSSDTLDSLLNLKHKASSERTSSLIADTYKNVDAEHSNIILRRKNSKIEDPSKITFTSWEEEFLKREIGLSGSEANLSQQDISSQDDIANRIEWTSMPVGAKAPNLKPKRIVHSDIKALHQIIDRQKKFHEKIQAKAQFPNPSLKNDLTVDVELEKNEKIEENIISNDTEEVVQIKPPPMRKKCLVRNLPKYKGFSVPGDFSGASARKTFKHIKQIHISKENKNPSSLKRIKTVVSNKKKDILIVHKEKQEKVAYKNKKLLSKTDQDNEQKVSIDTNTDSQKSSSATDQAEVIKSKTDTIPSDDGEEVLKQNIATAFNLSSGNEMDSLTETKEIVDQLPKTPTAKSVKRKAKKSPDEKMTPSPKIRHYDPQAVRDYIKKKKAERNKRHLEERRKYLQEAERKKQSLQKLYQFQKQKIAISKSSSPSKILKKTVEFPIQDEQSSLNVKKIHSGKQDQENEKGVLMRSKISEKPESYSFAEKIILSDSSSPKPLENENSLPKDRSFITEPSSEYKKKQKTSVTENIQPGIEFKSKMEKEKVSDIEEKHLHKASSSTSHYNEVERSSYISTISTPSKLTEFSSIEKLPGGSKYDKIVIPTGQSKQAETLKKLVKSINEMAEPFEHLIRTRKWIEESPPPPNHRPSAKSATSSYHQRRNPMSLKETNSSFVVDVAKSLHSAEGTSFKQQISKIGDTSGLYERLLGQPSSSQRNETDSKRLMKSEQIHLNSVIDSNYEAELIEGSLESEDETDVKSLHQDNLIEGIDSGDNALISHSEGNYLRYYNKEESCILPAANTLSINPDPFNFINTWNRKPIGIPALSNNLLEDFKTSDSPSHWNSTQDQFSKDAPGSLAVQHESAKTGESLLNTAVNTPSLFDDSIIDSFDNNLNNQVEAQNEKSLDDRVSSQETLTSVYTSVASESYVSSNVSSKSTSKQTESKNEENKKRISPSESSVSEVISVIENSKNGGEASDIVIAKNDMSSELKFASESDIAEDIKSDENDIAEDIKSDENDIAEDIKSDENDIAEDIKSHEYDIAEDIKSHEYDIAEDIKSNENDVPEDVISDVDGIDRSKIIDENSFPKDKKSDSEISESLSSNSKVSTDKSLKNLQGTVSSLSLSKVSNEITPRGASDELSSRKEHDLPIPEKSSEDAESVTEQNKMESASGLSASSHNSITIDFAQPVRFTYSNGVSKSLKIHKGMPLHEEQYFHTQVVTRVASEAAAAAATSAVIAVFETQKELLSKAQDRSNNVLRTFSENTSVHSRTESASPHKTTSENSVSTVIESNQSKSTSENSIIDEVNKNPSPLNTVREVKHSGNEENLPGHQSKSNKSSASSIISEDFPVSKTSRVARDKPWSTLCKKSHGIPSPCAAAVAKFRLLTGHDCLCAHLFRFNLVTSPICVLCDTGQDMTAAHLDECSALNDLNCIESISEVSLLRENSIPSSSTITESVLSDDSFAQLTLDVVRKITLEEELRATHQLALLKFQEQTLVENARAAMTWLESLKKNFREKGSTRKASFIKKKQKDIILRLRQERAQLRCMQEAYRSICDKHHSLIADKKKLLTEPIDLPYQAVKRKDKSHSSKASSEHKTRDAAKHISQSSSTSAVPTEEESRKSADEEIPVEELKISENGTNNSFQGSNLEIIATEPTASTVSSFNKSHEITPAASFPQLKQGQSQSSLSLNSNNSIESALQGLKKLEASKRHLTKREQRILQRRKHVEKILQWQMKLDSEEMAVRELEQKAVELVDTSKKKTKYYISSPATGQDEKGKNSSNDTPGQSVIPTDTEKASSSLDKISSNKISSGGVSESVLSENSVPEENIVTATSADSVEEEFSKKGKIDQESSSILSSSSIQEINENQSIESSVKTVEDIAEGSPVDEIIADEISPSVKSYTMKKSSSSDIYSESFESTASQKGMSPVPDASVRSSTSISNGKKEKGFTIKSPLAPRNFRRHDSSGSDDSYTISHSETASDQSDIEVRIHALAEELRRRKYEAEKLKREQKRKYREHLKGTELSLQKQVEAYNQYIQQVKYDLEHIEAMSSQSHLADISAVKPQIKWPRSEHGIDSRRIRKQTSLSSDGLTLEKKSVDNTNSSPESADTSMELPHMGKTFIILFSSLKLILKSSIELKRKIVFYLLV
ncbi:centrosome-associated protein 350 [Trichonephila clavipes]|nr:centrosome-associated protein 350 [Trichonephila clavipes]